MKNLLKDMIKLSNRLDTLGLHSEANLLDALTKMLSKNEEESSVDKGAGGLKGLYEAVKGDQGSSEKASEPEPDEGQESSKSGESKKELSFSGYKTKFFYMCPGAVKAFTKLSELKDISEKNKSAILDAMKNTDSLLGLEKKVLDKEAATSEEILESTRLVREIDTSVGMLSGDLGESFEDDFGFIDMHIEKILDNYKE